MHPPLTRKQSKLLEESGTLTGQYVAKKARLEKKIERLVDQACNQALLQDWTEGDVCERQNELKELSKQLEKVHEDALIELDAENQDDFIENEQLSDKIITAKARLFDRLKAIGATNTIQDDNASLDKNKIKIEVMQTNASGNIPNIWGKFDGDYSKWKSFHDKWVASMHTNDKVKTIVKFQNLQAACISDAKGALGEWDLTDENYLKAWERLKSIYEDDYMQVQSFMQKLSALPRMNGSTSKAIRDTIDAVQKHIHGLQRYIDIDLKHPYVVFSVIGKMDTETYRAWEKHRPSLAKADAERNGIDPDNARPGKYIPTWKELEAFLENEVTIRVHAERHSNYGMLRQNNQQISKKQQKRFNKQSLFDANNDTNYATPQCPICNGPHQIYKCQSFIDMNLVARQNQVAEHELCVRCLQKFHAGRCANKRSNLMCPKCLPENRHHNSMLCPNAKAQTNAAMNANSGRGKRKHQNNKQQNPKRRRYNNENVNSDSGKMQSTVNKVGEWSVIAKQSNAIKNVKPSKEGEFDHTVLLATVNMRIKDLMSNETVICRAIADTGATLNCIAADFVTENKLTASRCQKRILGISGPEIIKHKIKAVIRPWFNSDFAIAVDFFILRQLDGIYPDKHIEINKEQIMHLVLADEQFDIPATIDALIGAEVYSRIIGPDLYKHKDGAMMQSSELGHIILGKFLVKKSLNDSMVLNVTQSDDISVILDNKSKNENLESALSKFFETEEINQYDKDPVLTTEQAMVEEIFLKTHYREPSGRYVVTIPIKPDCIGLGQSKAMAKSQFKQLENRFKKNAQLKQEYVEYMRKNIQQGYMRLANPPKAGELCYWLPHHAIKKKFRIVLNASAKTSNGESLNSIQMKGAKLQ